MRFTNADPKYAGRDDDKQGGDTIMTMERVREIMSYNAGLDDDTTWLWLTSEQMGFPLTARGAEEEVRRAEGPDQSESQRVDCHPTASHLALAITDFILDEKRKCCDDELEQILTFLHKV